MTQNPGRGDPRTYAILGAALEVHRELGPGFLEAVYHDALAIQFQESGIPFVREFPLPVRYKQRPLGAPYRADFLCYGQVIVELKAQKAMAEAQQFQVLHYLKASGMQVGLLINFGTERLQQRRFILSQPPSGAASSALVPP